MSTTVCMHISEDNLQESMLSTILGHLANPQSILESVQTQLSHRAHAYYAEALGLNHLQCWKNKIDAYKHPLFCNSAFSPGFGSLSGFADWVWTTHLSCAHLFLLSPCTPNRLLTKGQNALVELQTQRPVALELYKDFKELGRFMLRYGGSTVAAGVVTEVSAMSS